MACHHCHHEHCEVEEEHNEKEEKLSMYLYGIGILFLVLSLIPIFTEFRVVFVVLAILFSGYELLWNGIKNIFLLFNSLPMFSAFVLSPSFATIPK